MTLSELQSEKDRMIGDVMLIRWQSISNFIVENLGVFNKDAFLANEIASALHDVAYGNNIRSAAYRLFAIEFAITDLSSLKAVNHQAFSKLSRSLRTSKEASAYYGARFELSIASRLVKESIEFLMPDPPDITLYGDYNGISIECTVAHFENDRGSNSRKIKAKMEEKNGKPYANNSTLLCIDHTNLYYGMAKNIDDIDDDMQYHFDVFKTFDNSKFGAMLLMTTAILEDPLEIHQVYNRYTHKNCSARLRRFMDEFYPVGNIRAPLLPLHHA